MFSVKYELNLYMKCRFSVSGEGLKTSANADTVTHLTERNAGDADGS